MIESCPTCTPFSSTAAMPTSTRSSIVAAVDDGGVPDRHFVADGRRMRLPHHVDHRQVLDVGARPMRIWLTSPRMTTFIHTEDSAPMTTSPMTWALSSTYAVGIDSRA